MTVSVSLTRVLLQVGAYQGVLSVEYEEGLPDKVPISLICPFWFTILCRVSMSSLRPVKINNTELPYILLTRMATQISGTGRQIIMFHRGKGLPKVLQCFQPIFRVLHCIFLQKYPKLQYGATINSLDKSSIGLNLCIIRMFYSMCKSYRIVTSILYRTWTSEFH